MEYSTTTNEPTPHALSTRVSSSPIARWIILKYALRSSLPREGAGRSGLSTTTSSLMAARKAASSLCSRESSQAWAAATLAVSSAECDCSVTCGAPLGMAGGCSAASSLGPAPSCVLTTATSNTTCTSVMLPSSFVQSSVMPLNVTFFWEAGTPIQSRAWVPLIVHSMASVESVLHTRDEANVRPSKAPNRASCPFCTPSLPRASARPGNVKCESTSSVAARPGMPGAPSAAMYESPAAFSFGVGPGAAAST